jgi:hypothetical protein
MNPSPTLNLVLFIVLVICVTTTAAKPGIELSLDSQRSVVLDVQMPKSKMISFVDDSYDTHTQIRASYWTSLSTCLTSHTRQSIETKDCERVKYKLTWDGKPRDRIYPAIVQLNNGGVLVFTSYIQVRDETGPLPIRAVAPKGGIAVFRGKKSSLEIDLPLAEIRSGSRGWVYLGPDDFIENPSAQILIDKGIPAKFGDALRDALLGLIATYATQLESKSNARPSVYLTWNNRDNPGVSFQADTVPGSVIRFSLEGMGWNSTTPENVTKLTTVAAHELAHLWNADLYSVRGEPWLYEGNAELLSVSALFASSLIDSNGVSTRVNRAFSDCAAAADGKSWKQLVYARSQGSIPYDCGMAIQFATVAASQKNQVKDSAFGFWKDFWREYPVYDEGSFVRFVEKRVGTEFSESLERLLKDDAWPIEDALYELLRPHGGVIENNFSWGSSAKRELLRAFTTNLLIQDCPSTSNSVGFGVGEHGIQVDPTMRCRHINSGSTIVGFEGAHPVQDFEEAMSRAKRACFLNGAIQVQIEGRGMRELPCSAFLIRNFPRTPRATRVPSTVINRVMESKGAGSKLAN